MRKKKRDYSFFIDDILGAIEKIERYASVETFQEFSRNEMAIDAVIRNFEVIGEAARSIPEEVRQKFPHVEWQEIVGFRNVLIHEYFGIDVESVWDTIQKNIPALKKHVMEMKGDKGQPSLS